MKRLPLVAVCLSAGLAAGCAAIQNDRIDPYRLPPGSTVELMKGLTFPPNSARTYIQHGESVRRRDVNKFKPYCSFGLDRGRDDQPLAREIRPTRFEVRKVDLDVQAAADNAPSMMVASSSGSGRGGGGTPWPFTFSTRMALFSADEPQVANLTCTYDGHPWDRNLTVDQIRRTLGDIARID